MMGTTMNWQGAIVKDKSFRLNAKTVALAAALAVSTGGYALAADMAVKAMPPAPAVPFFFVNDNSVSFTWYPGATDPGVPGSSGSIQGGVAGTGMHTNRFSAGIDHFDVWEYGTNIFHLEMNQYGTNDPTNGENHAAGSTEVVGFGHSTISFNDVTHSKMFSTFLTKDVGFSFGGFAAGEDNLHAADDRQLDVGLAFDLNLPGTVILNVWAQKEWNHSSFLSCGTAGTAPNGICTAPFAGSSFGGNIDNEWTPKLDLFVAEPLKFLPPSLPLTWVSITDVTFPKGTGVSTANIAATVTPPFLGCNTFALNLACNETKTEVFSKNELRYDIGKVAWGKPGIWEGYVGYFYWYNKFGIDHNAAFVSTPQAPGTAIEKTAYIGTTYHFK
jgi:hypothetical protein